MNKEKILKLINNLIEGDLGFEADCIKSDIIQGRKVDEKTKQFAELIVTIYKITHPIFSSCKHLDWEKETKKCFKTI